MDWKLNDLKYPLFPSSATKTKLLKLQLVLFLPSVSCVLSCDRYSFLCVCVCTCRYQNTRLAAGSSHLILLRYETVQPNLSSLISVLSFWGFTLELKIWLFDNYTTKSLCFVFLLFVFRDIHYINHRFVYLLNIKWNLFNFFFVSRDLHYIKANFVNFRFKSVIFFLLFFFGIQICSFFSICSFWFVLNQLKMYAGVNCGMQSSIIVSVNSNSKTHWFLHVLWLKVIGKFKL